MQESKVNFVLTGVPRSGTSLLSSLLCNLPNTYCFNEIYYNVKKLPNYLNKSREMLVNNMAIPNKYTGNKLTTNTSDEVEVKMKKVNNKYNMNANVGSNINIPYMNIIQYIVDNENINRTIFLIRNPIYNIASFYSNKKRLSLENCLPKNLEPRFYGTPMSGKNTIERQAEIINHLLYKINMLRNRSDCMVIKYEDLMEYTKDNLNRIIAFFDKEIINLKVPKFTSRNKESNYNIDFSKIKEAVKQYCPLRKEFSYA